MYDPIFLSASVPYRDTDRYVPDPLAIREAVLALVAVASPTREIVFGGHPAISPLVEHAARSLGTLDNITIFQSREFEKRIPPEARLFPNLKWSDQQKNEHESLRHMRKEMLAYRKYGAAVLIGGMDGVEAECELFKIMHPGMPIFPIASTRGAAELLWNKGIGPNDPEIRKLLAHDKRYRALFRQLLKLSTK